MKRLNFDLDTFYRKVSFSFEKISFYRQSTLFKWYKKLKSFKVWCIWYILKNPKIRT